VPPTQHELGKLKVKLTNKKEKETIHNIFYIKKEHYQKTYQTISYIHYTT